MPDLAAAPIRIARPSRNLSAAEKFWVDGVGMQVLYRADGAQTQGGHALLMLGLPGAGWHLELVATLLAPTPTAEDLLVIYLGVPVEAALSDRILDCGGSRVAALNPYWDEWGFTFLDPDGYRLVLSHRTWG